MDGSLTLRTRNSTVPSIASACNKWAIDCENRVVSSVVVLQFGVSVPPSRKRLILPSYGKGVSWPDTA